jgi:hypothetical protein
VCTIYMERVSEWSYSHSGVQCWRHFIAATRFQLIRSPVTLFHCVSKISVRKQPIQLPIRPFMTGFAHNLSVFIRNQKKNILRFLSVENRPLICALSTFCNPLSGVLSRTKLLD